MICAGAARAPSGIAGAVGATHWSCAEAGAATAMTITAVDKIFRIM
jgi:hypothetical protein